MKKNVSKKEVEFSIYDAPFGKPVYETEDGAGIVELDNDGQFTAKIYISKFKQWNAMATLLLAECREIRNWGVNLAGFKQELQGKTVFPADYNYEAEKYAKSDETSTSDNDPRDHVLFQYWDGGKTWRMYENDDEYMFIFQTTCKPHDFYDEFFDSSWHPIHFLRAWYRRVNGQR